MCYYHANKRLIGASLGYNYTFTRIEYETIFAVMNTTKKFRTVQDLTPWPLRYQCNATNWAMWNADKNANMNAIFAVMNATWAVVKIRPENNSGLCRIRTRDFCDTGVVLYQLSKQANWELGVILVPYTPFKWWINDCEYVKINFFTSNSCVFARAWGILRATRRFFCHDIQWRIMCK